jgi:hypothetical protein
MNFDRRIASLTMTLIYPQPPSIAASRMTLPTRTALLPWW